MIRTRAAIVGFGRLGRACAEALQDAAGVELAGVVRRAGSGRILTPPFVHVPVVTHISELKQVDVALLCVPADVSLAAARGLLQSRIAVVECAAAEGAGLEAYYRKLEEFADRHRARAVLGAGWNPGVLTLLRHAFEMLIPKGDTLVTRAPAVSLHHTAAAEGVPGVKGALAAEYRDAGGRAQHYVYVELAGGIKFETVQAAICADPALLGQDTHVFAVENIAVLEEEGHGIVLERRGTAASGAHQSLLFEGRFSPVKLAARAMLDGARRVPYLKVGAHRYGLSVQA